MFKTDGVSAKYRGQLLHNQISTRHKLTMVLGTHVSNNICLVLGMPGKIKTTNAELRIAKKGYSKTSLIA